jgi:segregation and condensation protein A
VRQATAQPARLGSAGGRSPVFRIAAYEGPLDLLLHLLKRAEVDVRDLPVSSITAQYLEHLQALEALGLDVAAEYLVMAATLVLIKSIALLPNPEPEELADAEQMRRELVERLLEHQRYCAAAAALASRPLLGRDVFEVQAPHYEQAADRHPGVRAASVYDLVEAMARLLRQRAGQAARLLSLDTVPIAQRFSVILEALARAATVEFERLIEKDASRAVIIATFLALLELVRQGKVSLWQERWQGPILLTARKP